MKPLHSSFLSVNPLFLPNRIYLQPAQFHHSPHFIYLCGWWEQQEQWKLKKPKQAEQLHSTAAPPKKVKIKAWMTLIYQKSNTGSRDEAPLHSQLYPVVAFSTALPVKPHSPAEGLGAKNI